MPSLKIDGTLQFPLADEANLSSRQYSAELVYTERNIDDIVLSGAQADISLMGRIADAKACFIEVISGEGDLKINAATPVLPITAAGGFWVWFNPAGGLTDLSVTTAADASFRVYMFR
jgi:hypothetical protein